MPKSKPDNYPEVLTGKESRRFWSKVDKDGPWSLYKNSPGKCWVWTAGKYINGYGQFKIRKASVLSHRLSYTILNGSLDEALKLDHLCRNRVCVNPDHLDLVTQKENVLRGQSVPAQNSIKVNCPRGHLLDNPNLVKAELAKGRRACLACNRTIAKYNNAKVRKNIEIDSNLFQQIADEYYKEIVRS